WESFPKYHAQLVDLNLEESVQVMGDLVELGRNYREQVKLKTKVPLKSVLVVHRDKLVLDKLKLLQPYFQEELNVRQVNYSLQETDYVRYTVKPNFPVVGKQLGAKLPVVTQGLKNLTDEEVNQGLTTGEFLV